MKAAINPKMWGTQPRCRKERVGTKRNRGEGERIAYMNGSHGKEHGNVDAQKQVSKHG
jgi:hypothetical protein